MTLIFDDQVYEILVIHIQIKAVIKSLNKKDKKLGKKL